MINTFLSGLFAVAWDVMLVSLIVSAGFLILVVIGSHHRERVYRGVDDLLIRGDTHEARDELRASARCYPVRGRTVMGVQQDAPEPQRTVPGARHIKGELLDGQHQE